MDTVQIVIHLFNVHLMESVQSVFNHNLPKPTIKR